MCLRGPPLAAHAPACKKPSFDAIEFTLAHLKNSYRLCVANLSMVMKSKLTTPISIFTFLESKMMLLKQITPLLLLVGAAHAIGAPAPSLSTESTPTPRYATQLEKFSSEDRIANDAMRLRVPGRKSAGMLVAPVSNAGHYT